MGDFEENNLKAKEEVFKGAVKRASEVLALSTPPRVQFPETQCPYDTGHELAHIHLDTGIICVSRTRLREMSLDQIEETASHEVAHLLNPSHDTEFQKTHSDMKLGMWSPYGVVINGGERRKMPTKKSKERIDKLVCNYHLCRKKTKLKQCSYCKRYFCKEHIKAKLPGTPKFDTSTSEGSRKLEEWRSPGGHPCPDYFEHYEMEQENERTRYREALDKLLKSNKPLWKNKNIPKVYTPPFKYEIGSRVRSRDRIIKAAIILLITAGLFYLFYFF